MPPPVVPIICVVIITVAAGVGLYRLWRGNRPGPSPSPPNQVRATAVPASVELENVVEDTAVLEQNAREQSTLRQRQGKVLDEVGCLLTAGSIVTQLLIYCIV